ncbi:hypothetical protein A3F65_02345 [Candidatus Saccharibacteria bacterium RIFCSPHIGHO2_12_FULL_47_16b]|nr:MAG: hypothetical protein A3F65_02345 [Candidatus Saccharibacteria bacterium RIFCSPHIGHO2_12_FULL_47_16b]OGL37898.1 MAG: hypothetical protein A3J32_02545 [Candidatus Saccharibacteria bacterium RIFCSPLOWO2_02_FULL_46_7]
MAEPATNPLTPTDQPGSFKPPVTREPFNNKAIQQAGMVGEALPWLVGGAVAYGADSKFNKGRAAKCQKKD